MRLLLLDGEIVIKPLRASGAHAVVDGLRAMVVGRGLRLTIGGIVIGMIAALLLARSLGNLLYKVCPRDPIAFGLALVVMITVAFIACFLPARRATRIDPVRALRT